MVATRYILLYIKILIKDSINGFFFSILSNDETLFYDKRMI